MTEDQAKFRSNFNEALTGKIDDGGRSEIETHHQIETVRGKFKLARRKTSCERLEIIFEIKGKTLSLGAQASVPAERESVQKVWRGNQVDFRQRHLRREARRSTQGCLRSQRKGIVL